MSSCEEKIQLTISVGGTKCEFAAVGMESGRFVARSERVEWAGLGISSFGEFVAMLARHLNSLLKASAIHPARVVHVGAAWPGPQIGECCLATFIPGAKTPQPFAAMLQAEMAETIDKLFQAVPITVHLDAIARAAGESLRGGALCRAPGSRSNAGMLVNIATGIAGAIIHGSVLCSVPKIGQNYGQFGRFLFHDSTAGNWVWRPSADGSVATHGPEEVRWTLLSAGPALASRFGHWAAEGETWTTGAPIQVREALVHFAAPNGPRHTIFERRLLGWITSEANRAPKGPVAEFVRKVGAEIGEALRLLLDIFSAYPIDLIVLAGGVGENFGRTDSGEDGIFLDSVRSAFGRGDTVLSRARLGVDAELLGFTPPREWA